ELFGTTSIWDPDTSLWDTGSGLWSKRGSVAPRETMSTELPEAPPAAELPPKGPFVGGAVGVELAQRIASELGQELPAKGEQHHRLPDHGGGRYRADVGALVRRESRGPAAQVDAAQAV